MVLRIRFVRRFNALIADSDTELVGAGNPLIVKISKEIFGSYKNDNRFENLKLQSALKTPCSTFEGWIRTFGWRFNIGIIGSLMGINRFAGF